MSGGTGVDPYYQKDPPRKQSKKKKSGSQTSEVNPDSTSKGTVNAEDARRLYFDEGLTLARVASRLRVFPRAIWRAFKDNGWVAAKGTPLDDDIYRLYFRERLSKSEVARVLGIKRSQVEKAFQRNQWKSIHPPTFADPEEARRLYDQGLTRKEIAKKLGVSRSTINTYLNQLGIKGSRVKHRTDEERLQGKRESGGRGREKVRNLQDEKFGTTCRVCGVDRTKRMLFIHRKDCMEHDDAQLSRVTFLQSINPEEWVRLCGMCHHGVHWANDTLGMDWPAVEDRGARKLSDEPDASDSRGAAHHAVQQSTRSNVSSPDLKGTVENIRNELFGKECHFCGSLPEDKYLVIHRKDGTKHSKNALRTKKSLQQLNPEEWVALCAKHHRYVHWARDYLDLEWNDIESMFREKE